MKKKLILLGIVLSFTMLIVINFNSFKKVGANIGYFINKIWINNFSAEKVSAIN